MSRSLSALLLIVSFVLAAGAGCGQSATPMAASKGPATAAPAAAVTQAAASPTVATAAAAATVKATPAPTATAKAAPTATAKAAPTPTAKAAFSLRDVDWPAVLADHPDLTFEERPVPPYNDYVTYDDDDAISGYPLYDSILYGNLGDGAAEEAVIPLESGGTAGRTGYLLFGVWEDEPELIQARQGYKQYLEIVGGKLVVQDAAYAGWEANCCPSGKVISRYSLKDGEMQLVDRRLEPYPEAAVMTVEYFYKLLEDEDFAEAYNFLHPNVTGGAPYEEWVKGAENLVSVVLLDTAPEGDGLVAVRFVVVELDDDYDPETKYYEGVWQLKFSLERGQWLLYEADLEEVD